MRARLSGCYHHNARAIDTQWLRFLVAAHTQHLLKVRTRHSFRSISTVYELRQYNTVSTLGMDVKPPNLGPSPAARISSIVSARCVQIDLRRRATSMELLTLIDLLVRCSRARHECDYALSCGALTSDHCQR